MRDGLDERVGSLQRRLSLGFWSLMLGFLAWDWMSSAPVDLRREPPLIAAGSGQATEGGHCSMK